MFFGLIINNKLPQHVAHLLLSQWNHRVKNPKHEVYFHTLKISSTLLVERKQKVCCHKYTAILLETLETIYCEALVTKHTYALTFKPLLNNPFTPIFLFALCHCIFTFTVGGAHSHTSPSPLCPCGSTRAQSLFFRTCKTHKYTLLFFLSLCYYTLTHVYTHTHAPCPLFGPEGYTERYASGSCSLISSSHTHSGSAITSGGPVRHECYPVDNNHSGGRGRDPIPYLLTAPHPPPGAQVALKKLVRYK